jgi:hypothetical protein
MAELWITRLFWNEIDDQKGDAFHLFNLRVERPENVPSDIPILRSSKEIRFSYCNAL